MKKLYGLPTVVTLLAALIGVIVYRFSIFDGNSAFVWRVPLDLKIYWLAGGEVAQGADLYDNAYIGDLPFTYPPFSGTLFTWLSTLDDAPLILLWQGGTALALFTVIMLVLRERGLKLSPAMWLLGILLLCCTPANEPVHGTLFFGQINIFLMLLVALDILPRKRALPGIGIGLAAGMKLTPAYMGLVLLFQKRWWQAIIAILTFAVTVAIGFVTIPDAADFWTDAIFKSSRVGEHTNPGAQSIRSVMVRAWGIDGGWIWLAAVVVVFILTCLALRTAMKHRNNSAALALAGISSCLVSPFSWYHHWVWTVPLAVVVLVAVNQRLGKRLPGILQAGTDTNPYYTNSSQVPVAYTDDPFEAQEMQEELQTKYTGGTVLHLYMNERISSAAACKELVRRSLTAFRTPYITITPTFSICPVHGYLVGEHLTCDKCAELHPEAEPVECEVWTRVMGYFRPVRSFNIGKKGEYAERQMFTEVAAGGHGPAVSRLSAVSA